MLISKQQQFVLDILQRLGCARKDQLAALLKARFFPPEKAVPPGFVDAILRQFRCCNIEVRQEGGTVFLPEKAPNPRLLEAVDVMLELSGANPSDFWAEGKGPGFSASAARTLRRKKKKSRTGGTCYGTRIGSLRLVSRDEAGRSERRTGQAEYHG